MRPIVYDVSPDGRRILMSKNRTAARPTDESKTIVVIERATSGLGEPRRKP
jgi:hypothetical protein